MALELVSNFANRLKEALLNNNISISEFAKKISYSKQAISAYINETRTPKRPVIETIARTLDVNEAWLIGYNVGMERPKYRQNGNTLIIEDQTLIGIFNKIVILNEAGTQKTVDYINDLILSARYTK